MTEEHRLIQENVQRHERIATQYDERHAEIYNPIEQERLRAALTTARNEIRSDTTVFNALDFGCGAGNLTRHLLDLGFHVTAADVTPSFVAMVSTMAPDRVTGLALNGTDLSNVPDGTYDLAATYSVLHHIPDYLRAVQELARVVRPGGIIFIDHESSSEHWTPSPALKEYWSRGKERRTLSWYARRLLDPNWLQTKWRTLRDPKYAPEGDIHVWSDDHIEWDKVERSLIDAGCEIVVSKDYLLYQPHVPLDLYRSFEHRCTDMHCCIARKI